WLIERYGEPTREALDHSRKSYAKLTPAEQAALGKELQDLEEALAGGLRHDVDPASDAIDALITRHRAWVGAMWGRPCRPERYAGLADLYLSHPDFVARYERIEKGFTEYLTNAMKAHAKRWADAAVD